MHVRQFNTFWFKNGETKGCHHWTLRGSIPFSWWNTCMQQGRVLSGISAIISSCWLVLRAPFYLGYPCCLVLKAMNRIDWWSTPSTRLLGVRDAHNNIVNILQYTFLAIQYIAILVYANTIYWYCDSNQYNILYCQDKPIQYIVLSHEPIQYIVLSGRSNTIYC